MSKGELNGTCNREACHGPGAVYFNHSTRKYYCSKCADMINEMNGMWAIDEFGHDLCTLSAKIIGEQDGAEHDV